MTPFDNSLSAVTPRTMSVGLTRRRSCKGESDNLIKNKMAHYAHIPIFQQTYRLTLEVYKCSVNFKKEHKYTLGLQLKNVCHELLKLIVLVNSKQEKAESLELLDQELESLRIYLRLAFDLKLISYGLLGKFNEQIEEIGKQIGGWQKWALMIR